MPLDERTIDHVLDRYARGETPAELRRAFPNDAAELDGLFRTVTLLNENGCAVQPPRALLSKIVATIETPTTAAENLTRHHETVESSKGRLSAKNQSPIAGNRFVRTLIPIGIAALALLIIMVGNRYNASQHAELTVSLSAAADATNDAAVVNSIQEDEPSIAEEGPDVTLASSEDRILNDVGRTYDAFIP